MYNWMLGHKYADTCMYLCVHAKEEIKIKQLAQFIKLNSKKNHSAKAAG